MTKQKYILYFFTFFLTTLLVDAQYCVTGCNDNTFINSGDPNTIEYDDIISGFHASMVTEVNGDFKIWGQHTAPNGTGNQLSPTLISPTNGYNYSGTPLKVALGSYVYSSNIRHQFALLTTDGLYIWGYNGTLVATTVKSTTAFGNNAPVSIGTSGVGGTNSKGLPSGVEPEDVKMMFGSQGTLAIVTCTGEAWILSTMGGKKGDGTTNDNDSDKWHQIKTASNTPLTNVVAMRGTPNAMMALTSTGDIYTWGTNTYTGVSGQGAQNRGYATQMAIPAGKTPKVIGMTQSASNAQTYYMLATDGNLYSLGNNTQRQLGVWNTTPSTTWVQPTKPNSAGTASSGQVFNDVVWISPNEHDGYMQAAINILTSDKKQYAWGSNSGNMIGASSNGANYNPIFMPGTSNDPNGLSETDDIIAVETGGHTTVNIRQCSQKFGYVGHKTSGSMGDGTNSTGNPNTYSYSTSVLIVCGAETSPSVNSVLKMCEGETVDLSTALLGSAPSGLNLEWWTTEDRQPGTQVNDPSSVSPGTYFAFFIPDTGNCDEPTGAEVIVSYFEEGEDGYDGCCASEVLFYEDFGISYLDNGNKGRSESAFMPANSFEFGNSYLQLPTPGGNPWDDNPIRNAARINDGFYAVVAPEFINDGWFPDDAWDSWWPPAENNGYQIVSDHTGNSNTATHKGAVMAINAGEVLAPFYENSVTVEPTTLYKASFWFYLLPGEDPTKIALDIFDSETNQLLGTVETALMGGDVDPSYIGKWTEHTLYFLTSACSVNDVKFSLRNGYAGTQGNDYFIDDIKLVKWGCEIDEDFYVEIECPNPPVATPDINQTPQNTPVSGNVLTNDHGDGLTVQSATYLDENGVEQPLTLGTPTPIYTSNGTLAGEITLNPDGTYTYVPATDFIGNVPVNYTAVDENGVEASSTLEITVIPNVNPQENNPPIAQNDTGFTEVDVPLNSNVLSNDSDPENDDLIVTGALQNGVAIPIGVATQVSGVDSQGNPVANAGTLTLNEDGSYTFVPSTSFVGTIDPITYTISDGNGGMDDAELFITVLDDTENNTFANDDANTAPKGETMTGGILENDTDPEGDTQTVTNITIDGVDYPVPTDGSTTEVTIPGKGVLTIDKDGNYTFVPEPEFVGTVVVEATVCDDGTPVACDQSTLYLTSLDLEELCFEGVEGQAFDWSYTETQPSPVTETMTQPGTSGGFVFDIYELDNSFNMEINGIALATQEIEFQAGGNLIQNIRFTDGDIWEDGNVTDIWELRGDTDNPMLRVIIDHNGNVSMYGSKVSYGPLFPLELFNGNVFNTIPWNVDSDNDIVVTQNVVGVTTMDGNGYGQNIVPCDCSKPGNFTSTGLPTKVGITSLRNDNTDGWPQVRDGAWIALESKTKGFVPNRLSNTEIASITDPVEGMMVYNTDQDCLQIYVDTITGWKCFNVQSCD